MTRTTRKEPISEEQAEAIIISGWRVTQPEADPDDAQHDNASQTNVGKDDE